VLNSEKILNILTANPKRVFLVDGIGALLSLFFISCILIPFKQHVGIPRSTLLLIAVPPFFFALYSLICAYFIKKKWAFYLSIISLANLLYCSVTIGLIIYHYSNLTLLGLLYFVIEIVLILLLVYIERKTIFNISKIKSRLYH